MIFDHFGVLSENPSAFFTFTVILLAGLIAGFTIHEFSHAAMAYAEGDNTARYMGRLTLNPLKHIDWVGFLLIILVGFGWAKPVQVSPWNLKHGLQGMSMVAFAGPFSNFLLAFLIGMLFQAGIVEGPYQEHLAPLPAYSDPSLLVGQFFFWCFFMNIILGIFNLIPIAPLDGSKVAAGLLPRPFAATFLSLESWGPGILITVIVLDRVLDLGILAWVLGPAVSFFFDLFL